MPVACAAASTNPPICAAHRLHFSVSQRVHLKFQNIVLPLLLLPKRIHQLRFRLVEYQSGMRNRHKRDGAIAIEAVSAREHWSQHCIVCE